MSDRDSTGNGAAGWRSDHDPAYGASGNGPRERRAAEPDHTGPGLDPEPSGQALRDYAGVLWRRKWVILIVVIVATAVAFFMSYRQPSQYEASAELIYEQPLDISNPLTGQSYTDPNERALELRSVGSVLASPDMKQRAEEALQQRGVAVEKYTIVSAPVQGDSAGAVYASSNVVSITATAEDPEVAAATANAYAETYVIWRKERVQKQITDGIQALEKKLDGYQGAAKQSTEYLVLEQRLQDLELLSATATGNFRVLVPATPPESQVSPQPFRAALVGFAIGLLAAIGIAFLLEQLDTRLRRPDDASRILRQPVLGRIPRLPKGLVGEEAVVSLTSPDGQGAEAFRLLRTNLEFLRVDNEIKSVLVTSSVQGEGKSVCVANLAVTLAMGGKKVFVVDADLRRPRQQHYFGLDNWHGVSTVVTGQTSLDDALQKVVIDPVSGANDVDFKSWARGTDSLSRVYVLTSGPLPPNPGEIVSSKRFAGIIDMLAEEADLVIVDSPAMLAVGDTAALASAVDGLVFLVDMEHARRPMLQQAAEQMGRLPTRILGLVLRVSGSGGAGYYSSYRYYESGDVSGKRRKRRTAGASSRS